MNKQLFKKPLFVLGLCIGLSFLIVLTKGSPEKREVPDSGVLVEVLELKKSNSPVIVKSFAEITPLSKSILAAEVSGKVKSTSPKFVLGGEFKKGETILKIDASDYEINVEIAQAEYLKAKEDLDRIKAQAVVAREEWELAKKFLKGAKNEPSPLVLLTPQVKSAEARLLSAEANLKLAKLNLSRVEIKAPYDGYLESKDVDLGQYLRIGERVVEYAGVNRAEAVLNLSASEFWWIKQALDKSKNLTAKISLELDDKEFTWKGQLTRVLGSLDSRGRLYRAVVSISEPYKENFPLNAGTFVKVEVEAGKLAESFPIPRFALREGDRVWLVSGKKTLVSRKVEVLRKTKEEAFISSDSIVDGDRLILTTIKGASPGMKLRFDKDA